MFFDQHVYTNVYGSGSSYIAQQENQDVELLKWLERNITDQKYRERYLAAYAQTDKKSLYRI